MVTGSKGWRVGLFAGLLLCSQHHGSQISEFWGWLPPTPLDCVRECVCPVGSLFSPFSTYILVGFSLFMIDPCFSRLYSLGDLCYGFLFSFIITVLAPPTLTILLVFLSHLTIYGCFELVLSSYSFLI